MSMDAGGLAQMTYQNPSSYHKQNGSSLGVPGSGFASRGKGSHIKRLSVPPPTIDESGPVPASTPRTSRSHLLAGLRTAPKQQPSTPATAPIGGQAGHSQRGFDGGSGRYSAGLQQQHQQQGMNGYMPRHPQTATGASFPNQNQKQNNAYGGGYRHNMTQQQQQMYTLPEQILAPPTLDFGTDEYGEPIDDQLYAELVQTNLFLAAQQQRLQQQLASVTAAAQQFQGLNLGGLSMSAQQQQQQQLLAQSLGNSLGLGGYYGQQLQQGLQPIVQAVAGQPGLFCVYNPLTGQQNFVVDHSYQADEMVSPASYHDQQYQSPTARVETPTFRAEVSPPETNDFPIRKHHSPSPPRLAPTPPQDVTPLPPPSANAFRRGHKPRPSSVIRLDSDNSITSKTSASGTGATTNGPRSGALPPTPMTGTFGPGQGRAGEHPIRQPRGPPSLEDLIAKPTSKYEGSKNFVTRQRRRAVHNLVRKGLERRGGENVPGSGSASGGSVTPSSDAEFSFGSGSGSDGESGTGGTHSGSGSTTVSTRPSISSLRAIGSERKEKEKKEDSTSSSSSFPAHTRGSVDSMYTATTLSSDDGTFVGGKLMDVRSDNVSSPTGNGMASPTAAAIVAGKCGSNAGQGQGQGSERRKMPMLVLSSAEKRKSPVL